MKKYFSLFLLMIGMIHFSSAQFNDRLFFQLGSASSYYNGSFSGARYYPEASINFKMNDINYYNTGDPLNHTVLASYSQVVQSIRTAIGGNMIQNWSDSSNLSSFYLNLSPKFKTDLFTIAPSIKLGYSSLRFHKEEFFPNVIIKESLKDSILTNFDGNTSYFDIGIGTSINTKNFYFSIGAHYLNQPNVGQLGGKQKPSFNAQAGYSIKLDDYDQISVSPNILMILNNDGSYSSYYLLSSRLSIIQLGVGLLNHKSAVFMGGVHFDEFKFAFAYNTNRERSSENQKVTNFEFSVSYRLKKK